MEEIVTLRVIVKISLWDEEITKILIKKIFNLISFLLHAVGIN